MNGREQSGTRKNEQPTDEQENLEDVKPAGKYIRIKPFALIMMVIVLILFTSGLTIFALTFGEKKL